MTKIELKCKINYQRYFKPRKQIKYSRWLHNYVKRTGVLPVKYSKCIKYKE